MQETWSEKGRTEGRELLEKLAFRDLGALNKFLSHHPAQHIFRALADTKHRFKILERSHQDIVDIAGRFHGRVVHGGSWQDANDEIVLAATKEIFTYSVASTALVQSYRHLLSGAPELKEGYNLLRKEVFKDSAIVSFFSSMRNANNHDRIIVPNPEIKRISTKEAQSKVGYHLIEKQ